LRPLLDTYCSREFLEEFFDKEMELTSLNDDEQEQVFQTRKLIKQRSALKLESGMFQSKHPYMEKFKEDLHLVSGSTYDWCYDFEKLLEQNSEQSFRDLKVSPCSVHLHKGHSCFDQEKLLLARPNDWISKLECINKDIDDFHINKKSELHNFPGWEKIGKILKTTPINSLIICGNYNLNDNRNFEKNIYSILKALLPLHINSDFHLSIIYSANSEKEREISKYESIDNFIKSLNLQYKVLFNTFILEPKKIHFRTMISNYFRIESDHNFDIFKRDSSIKYDATLKVLPLNSVSGNSHNLIRKKVCNSISNAVHGFDHFGWHGRNRLLNF